MNEIRVCYQGTQNLLGKTDFFTLITSQMVRELSKTEAQKLWEKIDLTENDQENNLQKDHLCIWSKHEE